MLGGFYIIICQMVKLGHLCRVGQTKKMAAGKSQVAKALAQQLTMPHVDLDSLIELDADVTVAELRRTAARLLQLLAQQSGRGHHPLLVRELGHLDDRFYRRPIIAPQGYNVIGSNFSQ